jgi:hypothetical protein
MIRWDKSVGWWMRLERHACVNIIGKIFDGGRNEDSI